MDKETLNYLKGKMSVPEEDVVIIVHVKRKDVARVCGALELSGVTQQVVELVKDRMTWLSGGQP